MFNFLLIAFVGYYFYKNSIKTGKFKLFLQQSLPNVIRALQDLADKVEGVQRQRTRSCNNSNKMSVDEARQILGVKPNASKDEITSAFKKLMLINHPDKGGSEYIAAKIIHAKQTLIKN
jgi:DnaJ family protein C protein 19